MVTLSAICPRVTEPDLPRPWRMPPFPSLPLGVAAIQAALVAIYRLFAALWRRAAGLA